MDEINSCTTNDFMSSKSIAANHLEQKTQSQNVDIVDIVDLIVGGKAKVCHFLADSSFN